MLLQWWGEKSGKPQFANAHDAIDRAIDAVLQNPASRTPDLGGKTGAKAFGMLVTEALAKG